MKIVLVAIDAPLADAWQRHCGDLDLVEVHRGSILDVDGDAVVSPANSFGFMDGGIDLLYSRHFGWGVQERLQQAIREHHHGELLVGTAEVVPTDDPTIPYLIAAPTMRVPMILTDTVTPFLAARAVLLLIRHGVFRVSPHTGEPVSSRISTVAVPGLGTGVGRVPPDTCALQVRAAIESVVLGQERFPSSWMEAAARHQLMFGDDVRDLQQE